jgi:hypothetical protein
MAHPVAGMSDLSPCGRQARATVLRLRSKSAVVLWHVLLYRGDRPNQGRPSLNLIRNNFLSKQVRVLRASFINAIAEPWLRQSALSAPSRDPYQNIRRYLSPALTKGGRSCTHSSMNLAPAS